jgi:hypothetical protein
MAGDAIGIVQGLGLGLRQCISCNHQRNGKNRNQEFHACASCAFVCDGEIALIDTTNREKPAISIKPIDLCHVRHNTHRNNGGAAVR